MALSACCLGLASHKAPWAYSPASAGLCSWKQGSTIQTFSCKTKSFIAFSSLFAGAETGLVLYKFTASLILSGSIAVVAAAIAVYVICKLSKALVKYKLENDLVKAVSTNPSENRALQLIQQGANGISQPVVDGVLRSVAFEHACEHGYTKVVDALLNKNAGIVNMWDAELGSYLHIVINSTKMAPEKRVETFKLIFEAMKTHAPEILNRHDDYVDSLFVSVADNSEFMTPEYLEMGSLLAQAGYAFGPALLDKTLPCLLERQQYFAALLGYPTFKKALREFLERDKAKLAALNDASRKEGAESEAVSARALSMSTANSFDYDAMETALTDVPIHQTIVYSTRLIMNWKGEDHQKRMSSYIAENKDILTAEVLQKAWSYLPQTFKDIAQTELADRVPKTA